MCTFLMTTACENKEEKWGMRIKPLKSRFFGLPVNCLQSVPCLDVKDSQICLLSGCVCVCVSKVFIRCIVYFTLPIDTLTPYMWNSPLILTGCATYCDIWWRWHFSLRCMSDHSLLLHFITGWRRRLNAVWLPVSLWMRECADSV